MNDTRPAGVYLQAGEEKETICITQVIPQEFA